MTKTRLTSVLGCSVVSKKRNRNFVAKWSYFYRHGMTEEALSEKVKRLLPSAIIIESGDHLHGFVGGAKAGSSQDSYMYVEFALPQATT